MAKPKRVVTVRMEPELYVALVKEAGRRGHEEGKVVSLEGLMRQALRELLAKEQSDAVLR